MKTNVLSLITSLPKILKCKQIFRLSCSTGMQHGVITGTQPYGLPLNVKLMPQFLNNLNYTSIAIGKWHLGHFRENHFPTKRGFLSHIGYLLGKGDYFDHTNYEKVNNYAFDRKLHTLFFKLASKLITDKNNYSNLFCSKDGDMTFAEISMYHGKIMEHIPQTYLTLKPKLSLKIMTRANHYSCTLPTKLSILLTSILQFRYHKQ